MSSESTKPMPGRPIVFSTRDIWGNEVHLYAQTWIQHILPQHPEMTPYQHLIQPCIEDPTAVHRSTDSAMALVFEKEVETLPPEDMLRLIIKYADRSFMSGTAIGTVLTAFPVDSVTYPNPKVGPIIHRKTSKKGGK